MIPDYPMEVINENGENVAIGCECVNVLFKKGELAEVFCVRENGEILIGTFIEFSGNKQIRADFRKTDF